MDQKIGHIIGPADVSDPPEYARGHTELVARSLDDDGVLASFRAGGRLPARHGWGYDERVVEYPWATTHRLRGRVLDAGSTLNHRHLLDRVLSDQTDLTIVTLAPEHRSWPELGVSYVFSDLRRLPFRDDWFDVTVCLSTLEHVGMDNSVYGAAGSRASDVESALAEAVRELMRVTRPGGTILVSVPFGAAEDHGWFRQFDSSALKRLERMLGTACFETSIFRHGRRGWRRSRRWAARNAMYSHALRDLKPRPDHAAAARAVACIRATVP